MKRIATDATEILKRGYNHMQGYNNGDPETIVPYEVTLYDNGIICKKSPHPVVASHMIMCKDVSSYYLGHDNYPMGFNFTTFHHVDVDHERRVDFVETDNVFVDRKNEKNRWLYEACSDLKIGDGECPRFRSSDEAYSHCMHLIKKEFNVKPAENNNRCIKKLYKLAVPV